MSCACTQTNTNTASINAQFNLNKVNQEMEKAMEQLSSGKKINAASDNAAGLSIATRMESQVRGLQQAIQNAGDGQSMVNTAEGAMGEVTNMLQRMRELSLQSANSVYNSQDREALNMEFEQLTAEIDRIVTDTSFNNQTLLDGSMSGQMQIGANEGENLSYAISNIAASSLGKENLTAGALATTSGSASGAAATPTTSRISFSGADTYTFRIADVSVTGSLATATMTADLRALATTINDNLAADGNTAIRAEAKNGAIELTNSTGNSIALTNFVSAGSGTAQFDVISGGGDSVYLDETAAVQISNIAQGSAASSSGVRLALQTSGEYTMKFNGVNVSIATGDADTVIQSAIEAALGTGYEVLIAADTGNESAAWDTATTSFDVTNLASREFAIFNSGNGKAINITEFQNHDAQAAGTVGTIRVTDGTNEAVMVDGTNQFTVPNATGTTTAEIDMAFSSATSDYELVIDDVVVLVTGDALTNGTAGQSVIDQLNAAFLAEDDTADAYGGILTAAAGGLGSLANTFTAGSDAGLHQIATSFGFEVVQNGTNLNIKKVGGAGDLAVAINSTALAGLAAASLINGIGTTVGSADNHSSGNATAHVILGAGVDAFDAVDAKTGTFKINDATGAAIASSSINLIDTSTAIYSTGTATKTAATMSFSANDTFTFKVADSGGATAAVTTTVTGGSAQQVVADLNTLLAGSGASLSQITARIDPNSSTAVILERDDGKQIKISDFSSTGSATALFSPSSGQGNSTVLNDNSFAASATATSAGLADATNATLKFAAEDFAEFQISSGDAVAVVRRSATDSGNNGALLLSEVNRALSAAGITEITATASAASTSTSLVFTRADGGKIDINNFKTDGATTASFTPTSGQGAAKILDDDGGTAGGKSIAQLGLSSVDAALESVTVIDNALQQISDERAKLGAISNRLDHTISNLGNVIINTESAKSRIEDADFAKVTGDLTKSQIMSQAATAMLAQANASKQGVLSLLQG
ncbi:flagellin [Planktomarina temperata]|nr:flagellin [Planktomarina temperata]